MTEHTTDGGDRQWRFGTQETPERAAYLLIQHVAGVQLQELGLMLRPFGITPEQYHVLRVLDDSGAEGLACSRLAERSVSGDPDVTRLLDRLEKQGWVARERAAGDRRVVLARITDEGRLLLEHLDPLVAEAHGAQFGTLGVRDRAALHRLLLAVSRPGEE